jgi:hypothetical protein
METPLPDLGLSADVSWLIEVDTSSTLVAAPARQFASIISAIGFVMEQLDPAFRGSAWIAFDGGTLRTEEIAKIHATLALDL